MDKEDVRYRDRQVDIDIHRMEYYSVIKNENAICSHMDTTRDKYAK